MFTLTMGLSSCSVVDPEQMLILTENDNIWTSPLTKSIVLEHDNFHETATYSHFYDEIKDIKDKLDNPVHTINDS